MPTKFLVSCEKCSAKVCERCESKSKSNRAVSCGMCMLRLCQSCVRSECGLCDIVLCGCVATNLCQTCFWKRQARDYLNDDDSGSEADAP